MFTYEIYVKPHIPYNKWMKFSEERRYYLLQAANAGMARLRIKEKRNLLDDDIECIVYKGGVGKGARQHLI